MTVSETEYQDIYDLGFDNGFDRGMDAIKQENADRASFGLPAETPDDDGTVPDDHYWNDPVEAKFGAGQTEQTIHLPGITGTPLTPTQIARMLKSLLVRDANYGADRETNSFNFNREITSFSDIDNYDLNIDAAERLLEVGYGNVRFSITHSYR